LAYVKFLSNVEILIKKSKYKYSQKIQDVNIYKQF
jgi:hypothetical protein